MEMTINFPGGSRVDAHFFFFLVKTDNPPEGDGVAPSPFALFLSALGTCAGVYVQSFCEQRGLPVDDIRIHLRNFADPEKSGMTGKIALEIQVPPSFPEKYYPALVRSAQQCAVKKHLEDPPEFEIMTEVMR